MSKSIDGIAGAVTERLNADGVGFLSTQAENGTLDALVPAIGHAFLNDASGEQVTQW